MGSPENATFSDFRPTYNIVFSTNLLDFCCEKQSLSRSENEWRSALTQKIKKKIKISENIPKLYQDIFLIFFNFLVDALFHLFFDRLILCFSQQKSSKFVENTMLYVGMNSSRVSYPDMTSVQNQIQSVAF